MSTLLQDHQADFLQKYIKMRKLQLDLAGCRFPANNVVAKIKAAQKECDAAAKLVLEYKEQPSFF